MFRELIKLTVNLSPWKLRKGEIKMGLESIVNVQITRGTKSVSQAGFGVPMILGEHTRFAERIRFYTSLTGVAADFQTTDAEYLAAQSVFAQEKKPTRIAIGRRETPVAQVIDFTPAVANNTTYLVTINGVAHSFLSSGAADANEIIEGLLALINAGSEAAVVTASNFGPDTSLKVTSDSAGLPFTYSSSANLTAAVTIAHVGVDTDLVAIDDEDPAKTWYMLALTSRSVTDIKVASASIEAQRRMFIACNEDANVLTTATDDIASWLQSKGYVRTAFIWSDDQAAFPEAAWMGLVLPESPGSETWKFKSLSGIAVSVLTATQETNLGAKSANFYSSIAGLGITQEGVTASGEYIDIVRGIDWLQARIQESVFSRLANSVKIPYTDAGAAIIENEIKAVLSEGVRVGLLAADPAPETSVPLVATVSALDKANRLLPDVTFNGTLAGAIHATNISGLVAV